MEIVNVFKSAALKYGSERRVLLLHGPVGSSKSTIARLLKRGPRAVQPLRGRGPLHLRVEERRRNGPVVPDARGAAQPRAERKPRRHRPLPERGTRHPERRFLRNRNHRRAVPVVPVHVSRPAGTPGRRLDQGHRSGGREAAGPLGAGPHRHRHVPAEGRKEPGLDRAHRRHQLPQDRRVRQRERSAGVQLRRRVQRRQPRA